MCWLDLNFSIVCSLLSVTKLYCFDLLMYHFITPSYQIKTLQLWYWLQNNLHTKQKNGYVSRRWSFIQIFFHPIYYMIWYNKACNELIYRNHMVFSNWYWCWEDIGTKYVIDHFECKASKITIITKQQQNLNAFSYVYFLFVCIFPIPMSVSYFPCQ